MNSFKSTLILCLIISTISIDLVGAHEEEEPQRDDPTRSFVVAELFTSEGCSSCPPADNVLLQLTNDARNDNLRVFTLGFHVDYWDDLGWRDRFSNLTHTKRQKQYARAFSLNNIYTPQLILNGKHQLAGYQSAQIARHINTLLDEKPQSIIEFDAIRNGVTLAVNFSTEPRIPDTVVNFAIVERNLTSDVRRGENTGKTLRHANVVRSFISVPANNPETFVEFSAPSNTNFSQSTLIGYVQEKSSMKILGANYMDL